MLPPVPDDDKISVVTSQCLGERLVHQSLTPMANDQKDVHCTASGMCLAQSGQIFGVVVSNQTDTSGMTAFGFEVPHTTNDKFKATICDAGRICKAPGPNFRRQAMGR